MRISASLPPFPRCGSVLFYCLFLLSSGVGCRRDFSTHYDLLPAHKQPPAVLTVDAVWSGHPPSAIEKHSPVYGAWINLLTDGLLLAYGEMPSWRSTVVVCYEPQLTAAQASLLVDTSEDLFLPNLQTLTPAVAQVLGRCNGILSLPAVESLEPAAAVGLAGRRKSLVLSGLTTLTAEAAAGLAEVTGSLKLDGLRSLGPGVAAALADHVGHLCLNGIGQLSTSDATALAGHHGDICLNGLKDLSAEAAAAVAGLEHGLHLNGLAELSTAAAAALACHRGWCLGLNGLKAERVDPEVIARVRQRHRR